MNHDAMVYEKALKKQLHCTGSTKRRLLLQFRASMNSYLGEHPSPSEADLREAFGPPEDMASVLMEGMVQAESLRFDRHQKWKCIAAAILVAFLLLLMVYVFYWKEIPISSHDSVTEDNTVTTERVFTE